MSLLTRRRNSEILSELEEFGKYLADLGLQSVGDRFELLIANIRQIQLALAEGRAESLDADPRFQELVWSLVEGQELTMLFPGIRDYETGTIKRLMERALHGPVQPINETGDSNLGRNTIFELVLGTSLRQAGASITLGEQADLVLNHQGERLYIECKRPLRPSSIRTNIRKALNQLRKRLDVDHQRSGVGGLVAISLSKAVNPGSKWFVVREPDDIQGLGNDLKRVQREHDHYWHRQIDRRIVGIMYHISTPVFVRSEGLLYWASHSEVFLCSNNFQAAFPVHGEKIKGFLSRKLSSGA